MVKTAAKADALLGWMGSLADPTRLRLLRLLERHELGVADLCDVLQLPQSTVSRHLDWDFRPWRHTPWGAILGPRACSASS